MFYIRTNKSTRTPTNVLIVDTETRSDDSLSTSDRQVHKLFMGVCQHMQWRNGKFAQKRIYHFKTKQSFWKLIERFSRPKSTLTIYSHNAGFDSTIVGLWEKAYREEIELHTVITESPPTIISFTYKGRRYKWIDSLNWYRMSLEQLGECYGIPKLKMPSDYKSYAEWATYCERDVEVLSVAIEKLYQFIRSNDFGVMRSTSGGQSLQAYRHRFMPLQEIFREDENSGDNADDNIVKVSVIEPHRKKDALKIESQSLFYADRWVYRIGEVGDIRKASIQATADQFYSYKQSDCGLIYRLDVNGLFPHVMRYNRYPCRIISTCDCCTTRDIMRIVCDRLVIAQVQIQSDYWAYPIRYRGMSIHATGRFWTTLCQPELVTAILRGNIRQVGRVCTYAYSDLFTSYVDCLSQLRIEYLDSGNKPFAMLCKDMLVSLYGKFAQKVGTWSDVELDSVPIQWGKWSQHYEETKRVESFRSINGKAQIYKRDAYADHSFPAIAAFVNSYAREYMRRLLLIAGVDNVYYTYIDSIHCNSEGFLNLSKKGLIHKNKLGCLKIEEVTHYANYRGIGDYVFGTDDKVIGISTKAERVNADTYRVLEFERLDSVIDKNGVAEIGIRKLDKTVDRVFTCGKVLPSKRTIRLVLNNPVDETSRAIEEQTEELT